MDRRVVQVLIVFLIFFVLTNPEAAGPQARAFAGWIGEQVGNLGIFLEGLFSDGEGVDGVVTTTTSSLPSAGTPPGG